MENLLATGWLFFLKCSLLARQILISAHAHKIKCNAYKYAHICSRGPLETPKNENIRYNAFIE